MTEQIEAVGKLSRHSWLWNKPDGYSRQCRKCGVVASINHHEKVGICNPGGVKPKPDESRLVEDCFMLLQTQNGGKVIVDATEALKLQDRKTAFIKDAEIELEDKLWCGALQEAGLNVGHPSELMEKVRRIIAEARKQERERIIKKVEDLLEDSDFTAFYNLPVRGWQALKQEEK